MQTRSSGTKERILDSAERLFAERGYDATSLRAITAAAGVNLAAVNYHFRSKDVLIQEIFARKLGALNRRRLSLLDALQSEAGPEPVPLDKLAHAFIEPLLRLKAAHPEGGVSFGMLVGRMYVDRSLNVQRLLAGEFQEVKRRFVAAFQRTLPGLPLKELYWRIFFSIGATAHTLAATGILEMLSGGLCEPSDLDGALDSLLAFVAGGMKAPLSAQHRKEIKKRRRAQASNPAARPISGGKAG